VTILDTTPDHRAGYHFGRLRADCRLCVATYTNAAARRPGGRDCQGSSQIVTAEYTRNTSTGAWAKTVCPDCSRKVGASRPTRRTPWVTVGLHRNRGAS
jgi:hypothetical protein